MSPEFVIFGLPAVLAIIVLIVVSYALRGFGFTVRAALSWICGIAAYVALLLINLSVLGDQL